MYCRWWCTLVTAVACSAPSVTRFAHEQTLNANFSISTIRRYRHWYIFWKLSTSCVHSWSCRIIVKTSCIFFISTYGHACGWKRICELASTCIDDQNKSETVKIGWFFKKLYVLKFQTLAPYSRMSKRAGNPKFSVLFCDTMKKRITKNWILRTIVISPKSFS